MEPEAIISFSRCSGQTILFGSQFVHQGFVRLRIAKARAYNTSYDTTKYSSEPGAYIEVDMSFSQFAEAITTMNAGEGVPCTIASMNGQVFERPVLQNEGEKYHSNIDRYIKSSIESIAELIQTIEQETMSKKAKDRLVEQARKVIQTLSDNLPYVAQLFHEHLDKLEQKAKTEIAAYADMTIAQYGLDSRKLPQLPRGK